MKLEGVITALNGDDAEVQAGNLRVRVKTSDLTTAAADHEAPPAGKAPTIARAEPGHKSPATPFRPTPSMELMLIGMRAEEALDRLDAYLVEAYVSGMPFVRIVHGKGTGRLRQVIREALRDSAYVSSYEEGKDKEGGEGVTIAHLSEG